MHGLLCLGTAVLPHQLGVVVFSSFATSQAPLTEAQHIISDFNIISNKNLRISVLSAHIPNEGLQSHKNTKNMIEGAHLHFRVQGWGCARV